MKTIAFDTETFYSRKLRYTIKSMIAEQYANHPLFDVYMVSVSDGSQCWSGHPRDFNWNALEGARLISHNKMFDSTIYNRMVQLGTAPKVNYVDWYCSADMTSFLCNRRSLDQAVEHLLKIKLSKQMRADADGKKWPQDFTPEQQAAMLKYARDDAGYTWLLWDKFSDRWPEHERQLSNQTIAQGQRGVQMDVKLLNQFIIDAHDMKLRTEKLLPWLSDDETELWEDFDVKPTATKCIAEQCKRSGIPCPPVKAHEGEEAYQEWETTYSKDHLWIPALSSWRSINKIYGTFITMKDRLRPDGTMPFALKYFGGHTGRWSGDARINFQNFRKKPIFQNENGLMETDEKRINAALKGKETDGAYPTWVKSSLDIRNLIIPRPGKKMIVCDLAQIEPRVLAWVSGDTATLEGVRNGMSLYECEARQSMNFTGDKLNKKSEMYAEAKARRLALGYGAGWEKFIAMAADYTGLDITEGDPEWIEDETGAKVSGYGQRSKRIVAEWRAKNPLIADKSIGLWARLENAFKRSVGGDFTMKLPSGRVLRYENVKCERRIEPDEDGKPCSRVVFTASIGGRRVIIYGGKLCENLVQAIARDVFGYSLLKLGECVLFSSHDEGILEVDDSVTPRAVEATMSICPEWMPGLPLGAEGKFVPCYCK